MQRYCKKISQTCTSLEFYSQIIVQLTLCNKKIDYQYKVIAYCYLISSNSLQFVILYMFLQTKMQ